MRAPPPLLILLLASFAAFTSAGTSYDVQSTALSTFEQEYDVLPDAANARIPSFPSQSNFSIITTRSLFLPSRRLESSRPPLRVDNYRLRGVLHSGRRTVALLEYTPDGSLIRASLNDFIGMWRVNVIGPESIQLQHNDAAFTVDIAEESSTKPAGPANNAEVGRPMSANSPRSISNNGPELVQSRQSQQKVHEAASEWRVSTGPTMLEVPSTIRPNLIERSGEHRRAANNRKRSRVDWTPSKQGLPPPPAVVPPYVASVPN